MKKLEEKLLPAKPVNPSTINFVSRAQEKGEEISGILDEGTEFTLMGEK